VQLCFPVATFHFPPCTIGVEKTDWYVTDSVLRNKLNLETHFRKFLQPTVALKASQAGYLERKEKARVPPSAKGTSHQNQQSNTTKENYRSYLTSN
jgi:hypothetical protein